MTIEAPSAEQSYLPVPHAGERSGVLHVLGHVRVGRARRADAEDLTIDVAWTFAHDPHRVDRYDMRFNWPSLPERALERPRAVASCARSTRRSSIRRRSRSTLRRRTATDAVGPHASSIRVTVPVVRFTVAGQMLSAASADRTPWSTTGPASVCTRLAGVLRKWDRDEALEVVPSQAPGVTARFPWIPARAYAEALQLIGPDGQTWQGAAAIEQLLAILPKGKLISWIFKIPFVRAIADRSTAGSPATAIGSAAANTVSRGRSMWSSAIAERSASVAHSLTTSSSRSSSSSPRVCTVSLTA